MQAPKIGPFGLVDFASRIASAGARESSGVNIIAQVAAAPRVGIRQRLQRVRFFLGEIGREYELEPGSQRMEARGKIGFLTNGFEIRGLSPDIRYC